MKKQKMYFVTKLFFLSIILFAFVFMNSCQKDSGLTDIETQEEQANPGVYSNAKKIEGIGESQTKEAPCAPSISINTPANGNVYKFDNFPVYFNQIGYNVTVNYLRYPASVNVSIDGSTLNNFNNLPTGNWTFWNDYTTANPSLSAGEHTLTVSAVNPGGCSSSKSVVFTVQSKDFNVSISGPSNIYYPNKGQPVVTATWCAIVNPTGTYTYNWSRSTNSSPFYPVGCASPCYSKQYYFQGYGQSSVVTLKVDVTKNGVTKTAYKTVYESSSDGAIVPY